MSSDTSKSNIIVVVVVVRLSISVLLKYSSFENIANSFCIQHSIQMAQTHLQQSCFHILPGLALVHYGIPLEMSFWNFNTHFSTAQSDAECIHRNACDNVALLANSVSYAPEQPQMTLHCTAKWCTNRVPL